MRFLSFSDNKQEKIGEKSQEFIKIGREKRFIPPFYTLVKQMIHVGCVVSKDVVLFKIFAWNII